MVFPEPTSLEEFLALLPERSNSKSKFEREVYNRKTGVLAPNICIFLNERVVPGSDLKRQVAVEYDRLTIFVPISGDDQFQFCP